VKTEIIPEKTLPITQRLFQNTISGAVVLLDAENPPSAIDRDYSAMVLHPGNDTKLRVGQYIESNHPRNWVDWVPVINPITIRFTP